jgi:hypothetical protein
MANAPGSYGYVVVKADWVLHEAVQLLLNISRQDVAQARAAGYHMFEIRILNDNTIAGLLAEIDIPKRDRNGEASHVVKAQVLFPWQQIDALVCFTQGEFGEVKRDIGFLAGQKGPLSKRR